MLSCSVAFQSVSSCVHDLDECRSLQLKDLLSEYFDKRHDRDNTLKPVEIEELDKYKVKHVQWQLWISSMSVVSVANVPLHLCVCWLVAAGLGTSDQSRHQKFYFNPK